MLIQTRNPANGDIIDTYTVIDDVTINQRISKSNDCFSKWRKSSFSERRELMCSIAEHLRIQKMTLASLMTKEMGKPITASLEEIDKCVWVCEHYAQHAENYLATREIKTDMKKSLVSYQPLGVIFAIMPWNFPFWQVFRFAAPTIMAGNVGLLSHAPISTGCGNAIENLILHAGAPKYLFQHLIVDNDGAATVIGNEYVAGVTLTGSDKAGSAVAQTAGRYLKKVMLELGGSDPYIVLEDADLDLAAECIVKSRLNNCGQVCIAAKRAIVVRGLEKTLADKIQYLVRSYIMGLPSDPNTQVGPMAREDLRVIVHQQVIDSVALGATLISGGEIPDGPGFYYPPTVLVHVRPGMPAFDEELFGPVISIITAEDEADAIKLANNSKFGLGAAVFTRDLVKGERIATYEIESGSCFVNSYVVSDPRLPFGGVKSSGFGRELSQEGILEFVNIKTIGIHE